MNCGNIKNIDCSNLEGMYGINCEGNNKKEDS